MTVLIWLLAALFAYLLGALPFGYLVARARGVDIRREGSGNIGATNVFRVLGKKLGAVTLMLDIGKGFVASRLAPHWVTQAFGVPQAGIALPLLCAVMTVVGHNWTVFLGFRGGKGVATSVGVLLGLAPAAGLLGIVVWLLTLAISRYVSVASIMAAAFIGISGWPLYYTKQGIGLPLVLSVLAALAIVRHRTNISRLRKGTEMRIDSRRAQQSK